jgi:hypothetical protein
MNEGAERADAVASFNFTREIFNSKLIKKLIN